MINKGIWKTCLLQAAGYFTGLAVLGYPISFGQIPADFPLFLHTVCILHSDSFRKRRFFSRFCGDMDFLHRVQEHRLRFSIIFLKF